MNDNFQTVGLLGRPGDARVHDTLEVLAAHLAKRRRTVLLDAETNGSLDLAGVERLDAQALAGRADLVVAVGGDGTMLHAAWTVAPHDVPLLGINRGRLGFLADVSPPDMVHGIDEVLAGRYQVETRSMLAARLQAGSGEAVDGIALNDIALQRADAGRMLEFETWVDGVFVNTHGGDGLVIASPTGSTAYALSAGGPILAPDLNAMVIAPICPHTLSDRPIVVGGDTRVDVRIIERGNTMAQVVCDGRVLGEMGPGDLLTATKSDTHVTLLHPCGHDYYKILRSKLHWGRGSSGRSGNGPPGS